MARLPRGEFYGLAKERSCNLCWVQDLKGSFR